VDWIIQDYIMNTNNIAKKKLLKINKIYFLLKTYRYKVKFSLLKQPLVYL